MSCRLVLIFCRRLFCSLILCCWFLIVSVEGGLAQGVIFKVATAALPMGRAYAIRAAGFAGAAAMGGTIGNYSTDYVRNALKPGGLLGSPDIDITVRSLATPTVLCPGLSCAFDRKIPDTGKSDAGSSPAATPPAATFDPDKVDIGKFDFSKLGLGSSGLKRIELDKFGLGKPDAGPPAHRETMDIKPLTTPAAEPIPPPPPPPGCEQAGLDGFTAWKRAVVLDEDTGFSKRDAAAARQCYAVAAQQNIPIAQYSLADMLLSGNDGAADGVRGMQYLEAAALNGLPLAQYRLARFYETATPADLKRALRWYGEAAVAGSAEAQYELSRFYYQGLGTVTPDRIAAFGWLNVALKNRYQPATETMHALLDILNADARALQADAQFAMGVAWEDGVPGFITADPREAFIAYRNAQRQGWPEAESALRHLCASTGVCR